MIFFVSLIFFGISINITSEMDNYIQKSDSNPLLVAYTLLDDPLSNVVENLAQRISKADDLDLFVIHIVCNNFYDICSRYPSKNYPSFVLYRSKNPVFHVEYSGNFVYSELYSFLHKIFKESPIILNDQTQLSSELQSRSPYSSFVFYHNHETKNLTSILQSYALSIGNSFYTFSSQYSFFEAYYSQYYHVKYSGPFIISNMTDFIAFHHHSIYHEFTYEDLIDFQSEKDILLIVSTRTLSSEDFEILLIISSYFGYKYSYGYINPFSDSRLNQTFETFSEDPPYFAYIDRKTNEMFKLLQPLTPSNVKRFILNVTRYKNHINKTHTGYVILFLSNILLLSIFLIFRFHNQYQKILNYLIEISFKKQNNSSHHLKSHHRIKKKKVYIENSLIQPNNLSDIQPNSNDIQNEAIPIKESEKDIHSDKKRKKIKKRKI